MSSSVSPPALLAGTSIVVADDHADSAELLQLVLQAAGADVRTAGCGQEVLDLLGTFEPDAFLLDITLPDMDGYELLTAIRALPGFAQTPAVAVTGHDAERDGARGSAAGFSAHILKPFRRDALLHLVAELVTPPAQR